MSTKHTAGKWQVYQNTVGKHGNNTVFIISDGDVKTADCIAKVEHGRLDRANLIAAAPAMLEALDGMLRYYDTHQSTDSRPHLIIAHAAIALARGGEV